MGSRSIPAGGKQGLLARHTLDDSGQLSIDFFIGLSIFLITLIIASTMISGLLINLQNKQIDYDAVAYRTGVLLVEDPGEPNTQFNYLTITETDQWEFIGYDQRDQVRRFGLTLYKSTPRVLGEQKIFSFNNTSRFRDLSEYRDRIIFGDIPYRFNITLKVMGREQPYTVGDAFFPDSAYGYIRRVVLVKSQTSAEIDMAPYYNNSTPGTGKFYVDLTYGNLFNQTRGPQYWIEPPKEDITINLTNVSAIRNQTGPGIIRLNTIRLRYVARNITGGIEEDYLPRDVTAVIDNTTTVTFPGSGLPLLTIVNSAINITFPAGYFIPPSAYANVTLIQMKVTYNFDPPTVNISPNTYEYLPDNPDSPGFSPPQLTPGVLEVRVW